MLSGSFTVVGETAAADSNAVGGFSRDGVCGDMTLVATTLGGNGGKRALVFH